MDTRDDERVLLLVDVSYQVHRATHAHPKLTCGDTFTGGLYGFFATLGKMVRETRATHAAFCIDWPPYVRSEEYPQYKQLRKKGTDPEVKARVDASKLLVMDALSAIGAGVYGVQGFEADDFISGFALRYRHRFSRIYAGSNDSDLWQLLWMENFALYKTDIENLVDHRTLADLDVTPAQYMLATAMAGTHNDVEGIPRVGITTALKAIQDPPHLRRLLGIWEGVVNRNLALIKLPHARLPPAAFRLDDKRGFNPRKIYRALGRYDIDVTDPMVRAFEQVLR